MNWLGTRQERREAKIGKRSHLTKYHSRPPEKDPFHLAEDYDQQKHEVREGLVRAKGSGKSGFVTGNRVGKGIFATERWGGGVEGGEGEKDEKAPSLKINLIGHQIYQSMSNMIC